MRDHKTLIVGLGEVGSALASVLERVGPVLRHDLEPREFADPIGVMHLCIPYLSRDQFESAAINYIERFKPRLTIVNSTVVPGTVRTIVRRAATKVAYSPIRGKHAKMVQDLFHYTKMVAAPEAETADLAEDHFRQAGLKTRRFANLETLELAKLAETTYFGVLIAFAQELNRLADKVGGDYAAALDFFDEVEFLPRTRYFPGFIDGHCVIPNIHLLMRIAPSRLFEAVLVSNHMRADELATPDAAARPREIIFASPPAACGAENGPVEGEK
jgi:UDP-glucose/GDP-mannose dehydrogenase family protein